MPRSCRDTRDGDLYRRCAQGEDSRPIIVRESAEIHGDVQIQTPGQRRNFQIRHGARVDEAVEGAFQAFAQCPQVLLRKRNMKKIVSLTRQYMSFG